MAVGLLSSLILIPSAQAIAPSEVSASETVEVYTVELPFDPCSCVQGARHISGLDLPRGDARDFKPNTTPHEGAIVIMRYGDTYHLGVAKGLGSAKFILMSWNREPCQYTEDEVPWDSENLVGFYSPEV